MMTESSRRSDESESEVSMTDSHRTFSWLQSLTHGGGHSPQTSHISHSDAGTVVVRHDDSMQMSQMDVGMLRQQSRIESNCSMMPKGVFDYSSSSCRGSRSCRARRA